MATRAPVKIATCKYKRHPMRRWYPNRPSECNSRFYRLTRPTLFLSSMVTPKPLDDMHALQFRLALLIRQTCIGKSTWSALCQLRTKRELSHSLSRSKIPMPDKQESIECILKTKVQAFSSSLERSMKTSLSVCSTL